LVKIHKKRHDTPKHIKYKEGGVDQQGRGDLGGEVIPWHVHKLQIRSTNQLHLWSIKETIVILTNEPGVVNGFLREGLDVGPRTDDADIVWSRGFVVEGYVLADEHADADAGHVESVEEGLDLGIDLGSLAVLFVFQNSLG
jgi:hypothetical protein